MARADLDGAPTVPPAASRTRFACFDGLRAIAAISVMVAHASFASGFNIRTSLGPELGRLDVGVAVFFLISGFLLYRPFVAAGFEDRPRPEAGPYFRRRFLRIYPAYWVCLTAVLLFFPHPRVAGGRDLFLHYSLLQIYTIPTLLGPVQQAWSLACEVSFYVFLPCYAYVVARVARRARNRFRVELIGVVALYAVSVVTRLLMFTFVASPARRAMYGTWLVPRLDQFALGMLLAVLSVGAVRHRVYLAEWLARPWAPAVSWAVAAISFWIVSNQLGLISGPSNDFSSAQQMGLQFLYGATAFFLVLPAVFGPADRGLVRRFLQVPVVVWLGVVSYGIYLWHEAWLDVYLDRFDAVFFRIPFPQVLLFMSFFTILTAAVSWYVLERPLLRFARRRPPPAVSDA